MRPAPDDVLMMRASTSSPALERSRQCAEACRSGQKWPRRCTRMTASHSSTDIPASIRSRRKPALLTSTSSRPYVSMAVWMSAAAPSQSAMSSVLATAWPPASRIPSTTICAGASDEPSPSRDVPMSLTTTRAPSAANASAWARPNPPPAPVTMTTRSSQMPMRLLSQVSLAAVGHQRGAGDVARVVTEQEGDPLPDVVLEVTDPAERNAADERLELRRRELRPHLEPRRHAVGNDGVDPHAVPAPLDGGCSRQRADHLLGAGVEREAGRVRP